MAPKELRGRALGIHGAGGTLGMALGPLSLSLFLGYLSLNWRAIYLFWAVPILLYIPAIIKLKPPKRVMSDIRHAQQKKIEEKKSSSDVKSFLSAGLIGFMMFQAVRNMGTQIVKTFLPTYLHDNIGLSVAEAGLIYGSASLIGIVAAPVGGYFSDRWGDKRWLTVTLMIYAVLLTLTSLAVNSIIFSVLYWCAGFFNSSSMGAASSIIARSTPSGRRGLGYALYFLPGSLVSTISPILGAYIATAFGLWIIFPTSISILALSIILLKLFVKK
jgi:NNP family nitrate/nitrite transporter-like MFS transporter